MTQSPSGRADFTLLLILLYRMIHHHSSSIRFTIFQDYEQDNFKTHDDYAQK
jgi:hypothetical protein